MRNYDNNIDSVHLVLSNESKNLDMRWCSTSPHSHHVTPRHITSESCHITSHHITPHHIDLTCRDVTRVARESTNTPQSGQCLSCNWHATSGTNIITTKKVFHRRRSLQKSVSVHFILRRGRCWDSSHEQVTLSTCLCNVWRDSIFHMLR